MTFNYISNDTIFQMFYNTDGYTMVGGITHESGRSAHQLRLWIHHNCKGDVIAKHSSGTAFSFYFEKEEDAGIFCLQWVSPEDINRAARPDYWI